MKMSASEEQDCLVIKVDEPRIDAAVAVRFKDGMRDMTQHPARRVILDLSSVEFLDSSGLGAVVSVMKTLGRGRQLDLAGMTPAVDKVFRMTRMDSVFDIYPDRDAAIGGAAHAS